MSEADPALSIVSGNHPVKPAESGTKTAASPSVPGVRAKYHVMARGVGKQIIFEDDEDRYFYLQLARKHFPQYGIDVIAWCLMSNHVHWLVEGAPTDLSRAMQLVGSRYARRFNERHGRVGHLFQGRYAKVKINSRRQLLAVVQYIHLNPVKARGNLTTRWSSYFEYANHRDPSPFALTTTKTRRELLESVGGPTRFQSIHEHAIKRQTENEFRNFDRIAPVQMGMSDYEALQIAKEHLGAIGIHGLKQMDKPTRDRLLVELRALGLTPKQINRLTSIGISIVYRAKG